MLFGVSEFCAGGVDPVLAIIVLEETLYFCSL